MNFQAQNSLKYKNKNDVNALRESRWTQILFEKTKYS